MNYVLPKKIRLALPSKCKSCKMLQAEFLPLTNSSTFPGNVDISVKGSQCEATFWGEVKSITGSDKLTCTTVDLPICCKMLLKEEQTFIDNKHVSKSSHGIKMNIADITWKTHDADKRRASLAPPMNPNQTDDPYTVSRSKRTSRGGP